ncbi:Dolichyl-diphosphooligosaccharide--protein glycosyltransferase 48 kDa subunit [Entamoeba marina]
MPLPFLFITLCVVCSANNVLVIFDDESISSGYKNFLLSLESNGATVDVKTKNDQLSLFYYGDLRYQTIFLMSPQFEFKGVDVSQFIKFIDNAYTNLLYALDIEADHPNSTVVDDQHTFAINLNGNSHNFIFTNNAISSDVLFSSKIQNVLYDGIGLYFPSSPLSSSLLNAEETASTSAFPEINFAQQNNITLVGSVQARNNARVIVSGSLLMFADNVFETTINHPNANQVQVDNKLFVESIVSWVMQKKGVLEMRNFKWEKVDGTPDVESDNQLVINDTIKVIVDIFELKNGEYVPYNADDVQIIFKLLDPVYVQYFNNLKNGSYEITFQTPDRFGVYTLVFNYRRQFLTYLEYRESVPLRTFRLFQNDRFILSAFPFYAACASMLVGFVIFSLVYLNHVEKKPETKSD